MAFLEGLEPDFQSQVQAAKSNLGGLFPTNPQQTGSQANSQDWINQQIGSASPAQIASWAQGTNLPSFGSPQASGGDAFSTLKAATNEAGLASSSLDQEIADIRATRASVEAGIRTKFGQLRTEEAEHLQSDIGAVNQSTRISGGTGASGLGASSTRGQLLEIEKNASAKRMKELANAEIVAVSQGKYDELDRIRVARSDEFDRQERNRKFESDERHRLITTGLAQQQESRLQKSEDWQQKYQAGMLDLNIVEQLRQTPAGQTVTIGGKQYTGLKPLTADLEIVHQYDADSGNLFLYTWDKNTGKQISSQTVQVGTGKKLEQFESKEVNGRLLVFDKYATDPAKAWIDTGKTVPKQSVAGGVGGTIFGQKIKSSTALSENKSGGKQIGHEVLLQDGTIVFTDNAGKPFKEADANKEFFNKWATEGVVGDVSANPVPEAIKTGDFRRGTPLAPEGETNITQWESQGAIWKELASPEMSNQSDDVKAQFIKQNGGNPEDFGLYGYGA